MVKRKFERVWITFMKITISQKDKKISVEFHHPKPLLDKEGKGRLVVNRFIIAKADEFLSVIDKFIRKRKIGPIGHMEFHNAGILTERTIRVIMQGLSFS